MEASVGRALVKPNGIDGAAGVRRKRNPQLYRPAGPTINRRRETLVLGQMVCWATALAEQANTRPRPKDISAPTCLKKFVIDALTAAFPAR